MQIDIGKKIYTDSGDFLLRRVKEDVLDELPAKIIYKGQQDDDVIYQSYLDRQLTSNQLSVLEDIRKEYISKLSQSAALALLAQIKKCYLHPLLTTDSTGALMNSISSSEFWNESARLTALHYVMHHVQSTQEKLIIFVISRAMQMKLRDRIAQDFGLLPKIISGDTKVSSNDYSQTRLGIIDQFSKKSGFQVIILSPIAAGVGLNITAANHVFHLDRHWNPAKEEQANDRVYRIGQQKNVHIYYPISKHPKAMSFDQKLDALLSRKLFLKDAIMTLPQVSERELVEAIR